MTDSSKKRALIVRAFNDAGSETRYRKGEIASIDARTFANYAAAGLVTDAPASKAPTAQPKPAARKAASPALEPIAPQPAPAPHDGSIAADA